MRKGSLFLSGLAVLFLLWVSMFVHASFRRRAEAPALEDMREMAGRLGLTDLCLFTEASYTRHLSQTDLHTPFQDGPSSLEHFPSGGLVAPPPGLKRTNEKLD